MVSTIEVPPTKLLRDDLLQHLTLSSRSQVQKQLDLFNKQCIELQKAIELQSTLTAKQQAEVRTGLVSCVTDGAAQSPSPATTNDAPAVTLGPSGTPGGPAGALENSPITPVGKSGGQVAAGGSLLTTDGEMLLQMAFALQDELNNGLCRLLAEKADCSISQVRLFFQKQRAVVRHFVQKIQRKSNASTAALLEALEEGLMPGTGREDTPEDAEEAAQEAQETDASAKSSTREQRLKELSHLLSERGAINDPRDAGRFTELLRRENLPSVRLRFAQALLRTEDGSTLMKVFNNGALIAPLEQWLADAEAVGHLSLLTVLMQVLQKLPITVYLLRKSTLSRAVAKLQKHRNAGVVHVATQLLTKWLRMEEEAERPWHTQDEAQHVPPPAPRPTAQPTNNSTHRGHTKSKKQRERESSAERSRGQGRSPSAGSKGDSGSGRVGQNPWALPPAFTPAPAKKEHSMLRKQPSGSSRPLTADEIIKERERQRAKQRLIDSVRPVSGVKRPAPDGPIAPAKIVKPTTTVDAPYAPPSDPRARMAAARGPQPGGIPAQGQQLDPETIAIQAYEARKERLVALATARAANAAVALQAASTRLPSMTAQVTWLAPQPLSLPESTVAGYGAGQDSQETWSQQHREQQVAPVQYPVAELIPPDPAEPLDAGPETYQAPARLLWWDQDANEAAQQDAKMRAKGLKLPHMLLPLQRDSGHPGPHPGPNPGPHPGPHPVPRMVPQGAPVPQLHQPPFTLHVPGGGPGQHMPADLPADKQQPGPHSFPDRRRGPQYQPAPHERYNETGPHEHFHEPGRGGPLRPRDVHREPAHWSHGEHRRNWRDNAAQWAPHDPLRGPPHEPFHGPPHGPPHGRQHDHQRGHPRGPPHGARFVEGRGAWHPPRHGGGRPTDIPGFR